ncbi:hypothetical protein G9A89_023203 [Geosiphon pyriformis]|nr:hypothetical protein G9A89_023203 [Geosiphon pyriformis]
MPGTTTQVAVAYITLETKGLKNLFFAEISILREHLIYWLRDPPIIGNTKHCYLMLIKQCPEEDPPSTIFISVYHNPTIPAVIHFEPSNSLDVIFSTIFRVIFLALRFNMFDTSKEGIKIDSNSRVILFSCFEEDANILSFLQMRTIHPIVCLPILPTPFVGGYHVKGVRTPESIDGIRSVFAAVFACRLPMKTSTH